MFQIAWNGKKICQNGILRSKVTHSGIHCRPRWLGWKWFYALYSSALSIFIGEIDISSLVIKISMSMWMALNTATKVISPNCIVDFVFLHVFPLCFGRVRSLMKVSRCCSNRASVILLILSFLLLSFSCFFVASSTQYVCYYRRRIGSFH